MWRRCSTHLLFHLVYLYFYSSCHCYYSSFPLRKLVYRMQELKDLSLGEEVVEWAENLSFSTLLAHILSSSSMNKQLRAKRGGERFLICPSCHTFLIWSKTRTVRGQGGGIVWDMGRDVTSPAEVALVIQFHCQCVDTESYWVYITAWRKKKVFRNSWWRFFFFFYQLHLTKEAGIRRRTSLRGQRPTYFTPAHLESDHSVEIIF